MKHPQQAWRWEGLAAAGLFLLVLALPAQGQAPPASPPAKEPAPSFSAATQVVAIEVPVQVVRDGEPVRGLKAEDFEVWEGRRRLPVTGFEALDLAAPGVGPGRAAGVPAAARRHFLLLFDLAFSEPKAIDRARTAAARLVTQLRPTDLAAVATYSATRGPQLVLGFTADRRQLDTALSSLGLPDLAARPVDPLRLVLQEVLGARNAVGASAPVPSRDPLANVIDAASQTPLDQINNAVAGADRVAQRNHVNNFTRSLSDLARQMAVVEGRKYLVFLSEGFDSGLVQGNPDSARQEEMRENVLHGEAWRIDPEERYGIASTGNDVERMLEEFRRADCVIQAVDVGGLRAGADQGPPRPAGRDSLLMMARGTGGELYESYNDLGVAMSQMLQRTSVTYVLAIDPDRLQPEGEYHRLRVELRKPLRGARIVHRPGYYLPRPYVEQSALEKLLETANQVMSGDESDALPTAVLATPFQGAGEKAYVPVLIEVDGAALLAGQQPPTLPLEVYLYALDSLGAVHDFLTQTVGLDLAKTGSGLRTDGFKFFGHLDLLPGDYSLRVLVRNGATGLSGLRVYPVHVPAFAQEPWLLPPLFADPPDRHWVTTREEPRGEDGKAQPAYPYLRGSQPFVPAAKPVLTPGREVRLSLIGGNLTAGWKAEARVQTPDGRDLPGGTFEVVDRQAGNGTSPDRAVARFRPPDLPPGDYVLKVTATGGAAPAVSSLRFAVPPPARGGRN
ncbi:MAG TPA: VWA domain-containing protein [Thermoanaerobaculia bacterium]|nr:VWA domain-containing protein [Thermoanaerobaculia bacterium]